jgi:hypothetical protein
MIAPPLPPGAIEYFRAAGRKGAAARRRRRGHCERCGAPFVGLMARRFCSDTCKHAAARARRRAGGASR